MSAPIRIYRAAGIVLAIVALSVNPFTVGAAVGCGASTALTWAASLTVLAMGLGAYFLCEKVRGIGEVAAAAAVLVFFLFLLEGATYAAIVLKVKVPSRLLSWTAVNQSCRRFDPDIGYRWNDGPCRITRVQKGTVCFDQRFEGNNMGWVSSRDYDYKKKPGTTRVLVLGDSFTAGEYNPQPWPDTVHETLTKANGNFEVYSLGVDGGGLWNWHRIYEKEIAPKFEYDVLVLAAFFDNLSRKYTIYHPRGNKVLFTRTDVEPNSEAEFKEKVVPGMVESIDIMNDAAIDAKLKSTTGKGGLYWAPLDVHFAKNINWRVCRALAARREADKVSQFKEGSLDERYGPEVLRRFAAIVEGAKRAGKRVILASIPAKEDLIAAKYPTRHQLEMRELAKRYGLEYFDGYEPFKGVAAQEVSDRLWLQYDAHWAQPGSDLFARAFAEFLAGR